MEPSEIVESLTRQAIELAVRLESILDGSAFTCYIPSSSERLLKDVPMERFRDAIFIAVLLSIEMTFTLI
jgi:hypothetical protein